MSPELQARIGENKTLLLIQVEGLPDDKEGFVLQLGVPTTAQVKLYGEDYPFESPAIGLTREEATRLAMRLISVAAPTEDPEYE